MSVSRRFFMAAATAAAASPTTVLAAGAPTVSTVVSADAVRRMVNLAVSFISHANPSRSLDLFSFSFFGEDFAPKDITSQSFPLASHLLNPVSDDQTTLSRLRGLAALATFRVPFWDP